LGIPQTKRVLIVDDDQVDASITQHALKKCHCEFHVALATSLTQAFEKLNEERFDVVLLDLGLPESCGLDTLKAFTSQANPIPIVVLTGLDADGSATVALDEGAQDYLAKDEINSTTLSRAILHSVHRWRLAQKLRSANEQLADKNSRLAELYNTAQQFVDNVSHEFRTPLTVIKEFSAIMRDGLDGPLNEKQETRLDKIINRTDDLAIMVDDMLDVSKLEAGLLGVWRRRCTVADILSPVVSLLERRATLRDVNLTTDYDSNTPLVYCDDEKVRRVVINLAVNAVQFTPPGGTVCVWSRYEPETSAVRIGVTDTGAGISEENLKLIFDRFQQVDGGLRQSTKGFGLGLNIAEELVQLNLGQMSVASELQQGSTFSFTCPIDQPRILVQRNLEIWAEQAPEQSITLLDVTAAPFGEDTAIVVDEFLQGSRSRDNFVYRGPGDLWIVAAKCDADKSQEMQQRLLDEWALVQRNCPMDLPELIIRPRQTWNYLAHDLPQIVEAFTAGFAPTPEALRSEPSARSVLLVDDNPDVLEGLTVRMEAAGYNVSTAIDGLQALKKLQTGTPDAIVLDVMMPGLNGLETLKQVRGREETIQTPVVMLSASLRDQQVALNEGANFFITKPYNSKDVLLAIENSIAKELTPC